MSVVWLALFACVSGKVVVEFPDTAEDAPQDTDVAPVDADGDGYTSDQDCDDADPAVHPDADEHCFGRDDDCDGDPDAGAVDQPTWYQDADGDGWGDAGATALGCSAPPGYVAVDGDCDDVNAIVHPDGVEICDGVDEDCDGTIDDVASPPAWWRDADGDGYGDPMSSVTACLPGAGWVSNALDCDDTDAAVHPGGLEVFGDGEDGDCDGEIDEIPYEDAGYVWTNARNVVAGHTAHGWLLTTAADVLFVGPVEHDDVGVTLVLATGATTPDDEVIWQGASSANPIGDRVDAVCSADTFWVAADYKKSPMDYTIIREVGWDGSRGSFASSSLLYTANEWPGTSADVDLRLDGGGRLWAVLCDGGMARYISAEPSASATGGKFTKTGADYDTSVAGSTCVASPLPSASGDPATAVICDAGSCDTRALPATGSATGTLATTSNPWTTGYTQANSHGDWLILAETTGGVTVRDDAGTSSWHLLDGYDVLDADAAWSGSTLVVHAAVSDVDGDGLDDLVLAYGDPDVGMTVSESPFVVSGSTRSAHSAAVEIDGTDVLLAASADDDVAWAFLSL